MNSPATGNAINPLGNEEETLLPSESLETNRTREFETSSFRKSLAWDNAFYTSSGVLDSEELSIVNKGSKKCETQKLPGVEVLRSAESISTSLEFELFEDERPSMQIPTSLKSKRGRCLQNVHSSKKTDASLWKSVSSCHCVVIMHHISDAFQVRICMFSNSDESHVNIPKAKFICASARKDLKGGFNVLTKTACSWK